MSSPYAALLSSLPAPRSVESTDAAALSRLRRAAARPFSSTDVLRPLPPRAPLAVLLGSRSAEALASLAGPAAGRAAVAIVCAKGSAVLTTAASAANISPTPDSTRPLLLLHDAAPFLLNPQHPATGAVGVTHDAWDQDAAALDWRQTTTASLTTPVGRTALTPIENALVHLYGASLPPPPHGGPLRTSHVPLAFLEPTTHNPTVHSRPLQNPQCPPTTTTPVTKLEHMVPPKTLPPPTATRHASVPSSAKTEAMDETLPDKTFLVTSADESASHDPTANREMNDSLFATNALGPADTVNSSQPTASEDLSANPLVDPVAVVDPVASCHPDCPVVDADHTLADLKTEAHTLDQPIVDEAPQGERGTATNCVDSQDPCDPVPAAHDVSVGTLAESCPDVPVVGDIGKQTDPPSSEMGTPMETISCPKTVSGTKSELNVTVNLPTDPNEGQKLAERSSPLAEESAVYKSDGDLATSPALGQIKICETKHDPLEDEPFAAGNSSSAHFSPFSVFSRASDLWYVRLGFASSCDELQIRANPAFSMSMMQRMLDEDAHFKLEDSDLPSLTIMNENVKSLQSTRRTGFAGKSHELQKRHKSDASPVSKDQRAARARTEIFGLPKNSASHHPSPEIPQNQLLLRKSIKGTGISPRFRSRPIETSSPTVKHSTGISNSGTTPDISPAVAFLSGPGVPFVSRHSIPGSNPSSEEIQLKPRGDKMNSLPAPHPSRSVIIKPTTPRKALIPQSGDKLSEKRRREGSANISIKASEVKRARKSSRRQTPVDVEPASPSGDSASSSSDSNFELSRPLRRTNTRTLKADAGAGNNVQGTAILTGVPIARTRKRTLRAKPGMAQKAVAHAPSAVPGKSGGQDAANDLGEGSSSPVLLSEDDDDCDDDFVNFGKSDAGPILLSGCDGQSIFREETKDVELENGKCEDQRPEVTVTVADSGQESSGLTEKRITAVESAPIRSRGRRGRRKKKSAESHKGPHQPRVLAEEALRGNSEAEEAHAYTVCTRSRSSHASKINVETGFADRDRASAMDLVSRICGSVYAKVPLTVREKLIAWAEDSNENKSSVLGESDCLELELVAEKRECEECQPFEPGTKPICENSIVVRLTSRGWQRLRRLRHCRYRLPE